MTTIGKINVINAIAVPTRLTTKLADTGCDRLGAVASLPMCIERFNQLNKVQQESPDSFLVNPGQRNTFHCIDNFS